MKSKKLCSALAAAGLMLACGTASAGIGWFSPITALQDDNLDFVVDTNNNGTLDIGDRLIAVLEFQDSQGILAGQGPNGFGAGVEITAVSDVRIKNILTGGILDIEASGALGVLSSYAAGTTAVIFQDNTNDLNVINAACGTRAACLALAGLGLTDGSTELMSIGFFGDADESWTSAPAAGGTTIAVVQSGGASSKFGSFNFSQSIKINNTGRTFVDQSCAPFCKPGGDGFVKVTGSGDILGGQGLVPAEWTARSDSDVQFAVAVPEPGSLALFGLALAGLGLTRRRAK